MKKILTFVLMSVLLISCEKGHWGDCFISAGDYEAKEFIIDDFKTIFTEDEFDIVLTQEDDNKITIEGYEKIINSVTYNVENDTLFLDNDFACTFTKPGKKKVKIKLSVKILKEIILAGPGKVETKGTLKGEWLSVTFLNRYSELFLDLDYSYFAFSNLHTGGGLVKLTGTIHKIKFKNYALCRCESFEAVSKHVIVESHAKADCHVAASETLDYSIFGVGNVYSYGNPASINAIDIQAEGQLIQIN